MYGIVNKGIRDMVLRNYGDKIWEAIKTEAACENIIFINMHAYDDAITYNLIGAASKVLGIPPNEILITFGEYWITYTAQEGYGVLLKMIGNSFSEFLSNLDDLHVRVGNTYRNLKPPSFICNEVDEYTFVLEYHSSREGLSPLVIGLLQGLGKSFHKTVKIKHLITREEQGYDEFLVNYFPLAKSTNKQNKHSNLPSNKIINGKKHCPFSEHKQFN